MLTAWLVAPDRQRHVKCDEAYPFCARCTTLGRQCSGYSNLAAAEAPQLGQTPDALFGLALDSSPGDRELFYIMRTSVVKNASGAFDRSFWAEDVVRAAQTCPAVWHASLAMAAVHKSLLSRETDSGGDRRWQICAMDHYGRAIQSLIDISNKNYLSCIDKDIVLLSCILLIGLCCLWQDDTAAFTHAGKGLQLFHQWGSWKMATQSAAQDHIVSVSSLIMLFHRLEDQYVTLGPSDERQTCQLQATANLSTGVAFTSLTQAYSAYLPIIVGMCNGTVPPLNGGYMPAPAAVQVYAEPFRVWKANFAVFIASRHVQECDAQGVLILEIWSTMTEMVLRTFAIGRHLRQIVYEESRPMFERIVLLAERLHEEMTKSADLTGASSASPLLSFSLSACDPLLFFWRCSDGSLRRRAIALLRKWPQRDGMHDPAVAASLLEGIMLFEESWTRVDEAIRPAVCQCVRDSYTCHSHRVSSFHTEPTGKRSAELVLGTYLDMQESNLAEGLINKVTITW